MVKDYESGANRAGKFERDIRQLLEALEHEPENARYWFYLAQSYRDAGRIAEAAQTYAKRAALGGWDEEAWYARFQEARCLWAIGDECAFLGHALMAYNQRPHRAKSLYYLARFYRERGMHDASILFSEPALTLPWPEQDSLFIEDYIYNAGLLEEFSISANYSNNPLCKARGHAACNVLALSRQIPEQTRNLARSNLFFYVGPAITLMPSFRVHFIQFTPPDGYIAVNPSIAGCNDELVLWQRTINCIVTDDGSHATIEGFPVTARHFVLRLSVRILIV